MFFIPGYIVKTCRENEGEKLLQDWKQAIQSVSDSSKRSAKFALAEFFRRRSGERDTRAAAFLEGAFERESVSRLGVIGVVHTERKRVSKHSKSDREHWQQWK